MESRFNKAAGLEGCNFIKKRLQLWILNIVNFLWILWIFKKTYSEEYLRTGAFENPLTHFMSHVSFYTPWIHQKNESLRYFQWVHKEPNGAEWVHTPLYKNKAIFVCVSVYQALISNEKDVKNLKLSDLLSRRVFFNFPSLSRNNFFIRAFGKPYPFWK